MKLHFLFFFLVFKAVAQTTLPNTYSALQSQLAALPDTARFEQLNDFQDAMINQAKFADATSATVDMMQIAQQSQNQTLQARSYIAMGYLEKGQNNSTQAIVNFQKAEVIFKNNNKYRGQIRALQRISGIYLDLRELAMAERYCNRALDIARRQKFENEVSHIYADLATLEDIRKNYNKALYYNAQAIKIAQSIKENYSYALLNRSIIYKNAGQYSQSVKSYEQCLKIAQQTHDDILKGYVYINLPNTLLLQNRTNEAERYSRLALDWIRYQPEKQRYYQEIFETLSNIYEKKGQYQEALTYRKQWAVYRDSVFNAEKSRQLIESETRFQTREKQQQIQRLDEDNLRQKQQLGWLIGGVSLLTLLLIMAVWQYQTIRRVNRTLGETNHVLSEANQRINEQSVQLKELMRELHHRVKNNLAIVSSLLYLQSNRLDDENAVRAVREGQQRVEAMSLIHQQLYQTDNVTSVAMQEYIGDLVQGLMQSFNRNENFDLYMDVAPVEVDVELAVPLGLILNELVTNAFKHAYHTVLAPLLSIRLWETDNLYLEIKDNGLGIDTGQWQKPGRSFGKRLITSLAKQTGGRLEVSVNQGTSFLLIIPLTATGVAGHPYTIAPSDAALV